MLPRPRSLARISYQTRVAVAQIAKASLQDTTVISTLGSLLINFKSSCRRTWARLLGAGVPLSSMILPAWPSLLILHAPSSLWARPSVSVLAFSWAALLSCPRFHFGCCRHLALAECGRRSPELGAQAPGFSSQCCPFKAQFSPCVGLSFSPSMCIEGVGLQSVLPKEMRVHGFADFFFFLEFVVLHKVNIKAKQTD